MIDDIADRYNRNPDTGARIYSTIVSSLEYNNQEYILITDFLGSNSCTAWRYFTLSGEPVDCRSSLYNELAKVENKKKFGVVWVTKA